MYARGDDEADDERQREVGENKSNEHEVSRRYGVDSATFHSNGSSQFADFYQAMCVAEALLRIPDAATADKLIKDKFSQGDWKKHLGASDSMLVNAGTWGMMLTGKLVTPTAES